MVKGIQQTIKPKAKPIAEHIQGVFENPIRVLTIAVSVFLTCWAVFESVVASFAFQPSQLWYFASFVAISVFVSVGQAIFTYLSITPTGFAATSRKARRLAHIRPYKWEFKLAQILLAEQLGPLMRKQDAITKGLVSCDMKTASDLEEYTADILDKNVSIENMLSVFDRIVFKRLFPALVPKTGDKPCPKKVLGSIELLSSLYEHAIEVEERAYMLLPPSKYRDSDLHKYSLDWTHPIRDGVHQLFFALQGIIDGEGGDNIEFTLKLDAADNMQKFTEELSRVRRSTTH